MATAIFNAATDHVERWNALLTLPIEYVGSEYFGRSTPTERAAFFAAYRHLIHEQSFPKNDEEAIFQEMNRYKQEAAQRRDGLLGSWDPQAEAAEIESLLNDALQLRNLIAAGMSRLVAANARLYETARFRYEDLNSEGAVALLRAVEKFDVELGYRFSTYATHAIRRSFFRHFQKEQRRSANTATLERAETLVDYRATPRREAIRSRLHQRLFSLVGQLESRERLIIRARFAMNQERKPRTLQSLAEELGVCRERVRQIEQRALRRLEKLAADENLDAFV